MSGREAEEPRSQSASQNSLVSWFPIVAMVFLLVAIARQAAQPLSDPDIWWHLQLGDEFRQGRPLADPGNFGHFSTEPWVPTQWLPEVVASWAVETAGFPALSMLFGASLIALTVSLYAACRGEGSALAATVAAGLAVVGAGSSLSPRPHMLTYVFLTLTAIAWLRTSRDLRPRWWLVPLTWVWAMSHGMWFVGPALGIVVASGMILDRRMERRTGFQLLGIPIISIGLAGLTPVGPRLLTAPLAVGSISQFVTEWEPADFREMRPAVTAAMIALVVVLWAMKPPTTWVRPGMLLFAAGWTLLSARTVTLGAILIAPLLAAAVQSILPNRPTPLPEWGERRVILGAAAGSLALAAMLAPTETSRLHAPRGLDPQLRALPSDTVIVNRDVLGGWLMWSHPQLSPVVDGLFESYSSEYLQDYVDAVRAVPGWRGFIDDVGASAALLGERDPLKGTLQDQLGWMTLGSESGWVLLVAP